MDDGQVQQWTVEHSTRAGWGSSAPQQHAAPPHSKLANLHRLPLTAWPFQAATVKYVIDSIPSQRADPDMCLRFCGLPARSLHPTDPHRLTQSHIPTSPRRSSSLFSTSLSTSSLHFHPSHPQCPPASPSTSRASPQRPPRPSFTTSSRYVLTPSLAPHQRHLTTEPQFCGKLQSVKKHGTEADITFEKQSAMRTALMLNGGTVS